MQSVQVHGTRITYRAAGPADGPLVLLIHGVASQSATWETALPFLGALGLHVVAPDLPGHGSSEPGHGDYSLGGFATLLRDLLLTLDLGPATLVGHSMGGGIALQVAHQFPELSQRLVLVSSGGLGTDAHPLLRAASAPGAEFVLPLVMNQRLVWAMTRARRMWERRGHTPSGLLSDSAMRNYGTLSTTTGAADLPGDRAFGDQPRRAAGDRRGPAAPDQPSPDAPDHLRGRPGDPAFAH